MLVAARAPIQVGIVPWPAATGAVTVVVKRTYDLVTRGAGAPSQEQDSLSLEHREGDVLLFPTDFAPTKSSCDVLVVGRALTDAIGPVRIVVDPLRKLVERASHLGPRPGVGASGDPTNPAVGAAWTHPTFDFEAFQSAPPDQRIPPISLPLDIVLDHGQARYVTRIEGCAPEALLLDPRGWSAPTLITLRADQVMLDPDRRKIDILWRGIASLTADVDPLLVVEVEVPLRSHRTGEMLRWPRAEAIEPEVLRRLASLVASASRKGIGGTVLLDDEGEPESTLTLEVEANTFVEDREEPTFEATPPPRRPLATVELPARTPSPGVAPPAARETAALTPRGPLPGFERFDTSQMRAVDFENEEDLLNVTVALVGEPELRGEALPFASRPLDVPRASAVRAPIDTLADADPLVGTVVGRTVDLPARALPFQSPSALPTRPAHAPAPAPVHATIPTIVDHGTEDTSDPMTGTVAITRPPAEPALPFLAATLPEPPAPPPFVPPPSPVLLGVAARLAAPEPSPFRAAAPAAAPPPPDASAERSEGDQAPVIGITAEQFADIKAALWSSVEGRRETLKKHGLTELKWRNVEKRFASDLGRRRPDDIGQILARLRTAARRPTP